MMTSNIAPDPAEPQHSFFAQSVAVYDAIAPQYVARTQDIDLSLERAFFLERLPREPGHRPLVLDAGCGGGRDIQAFLGLGLRVEALDASVELARLAREASGVDVRHLQFSEVSTVGRYDGVWACASLLHLTDAELDDALVRLARSLRGGGALCAMMKIGQGSAEGPDGRWYRFTDEGDLQSRMARAGLVEISSMRSESYIGEPTVWLTMAGRKRDI